MFGLEFLFIHALWAVPLAGLPVVLHLLFRRKSPVVAFPTLRFVRSSLQQTAARKKVQRWVLLACRVLLLLLLIWAIAQPARLLATGWMSSAGTSVIAAIVVDTSYSMELRDGEASRLGQASATVEQLLRGELADARVAIFTSHPPPADRPERLETATAVLSQWTPLRPEPSPLPLAARVASAAELLQAQDAAQKWLIVLSDLQNREFPRPLAEVDAVRLVLIDLHPNEARSAGIAQVSVEPSQPIAGIETQVVVELTGRGGESRAVSVELLDPDGTVVQQLPPQMARLDDGGRARVRLSATFPHQRWTRVRAALGAEDAMAWDNQREHLVEIPPQQKVTLIDTPSSPAGRFVELALDPSEGRLASWPLAVSRSTAAGGQEDVVVAVLDRWPEAEVADQWRRFVQDGGSLVLLLKPGLESSWNALGDPHRAILAQLLPSAPLESGIDGPLATTVAAVDEPLLRGVIDASTRLDTLLTRRLIGFVPTDRQVSTILSAVPARDGQASRSHGLLYRRTLGAGRVYTVATLPESRFSNLATHPVFLPLLVKMSLRPIERSSALNGEIAQPLTVAEGRVPAEARQLEVRSPTSERFVVPMSESREHGNQFVFNNTNVAGLYVWGAPGTAAPAALGNVALPSEESELEYRDAERVVPSGEHVVIARGIDDLREKMSELTAPQPRWSWAIALVMFLLCLEALMGNVSRLWTPGGLFPLKRAAAE